MRVTMRASRLGDKFVIVLAREFEDSDQLLRIHFYCYNLWMK
jgi:hypothetical protein